MNDDRPKTLIEAFEDLHQAWRIIFDEFAKSLGLYRLLDKLTKEDEE